MSLTADRNQETKQTKETDTIKALLKAYGDYQKKIDYAEGRLEYLEYTQDSPSSPGLTGMPGGSRDRTSKQERNYLKKEELKERLDDMYAEESRQREEIEALVEQMDKPEEQAAITMRYLDFASWRSISATIYGDEPDYDEHELRYLKRTFKIHGSALQSLARIYHAAQAER